jgi:hypothetical protein
VVAVLVVTVMVAEVFWLYSPFGSDTSSVTTQNTIVDSTVDSTVDPGSGATPDSGPDPSADATTFATIGTVIIRSTPAKTGTELGKIPRGTKVAVACTATGDPVKGATKTDSQWDKVTYGAVTGYVTNTLMATGAAVDDPSRIPPC